MTGNSGNNKNKDQGEDIRFDDPSDYCAAFVIPKRLAKARTLIGNIIRKDGVDYGRIVKIISMGNGYDTKCVAVTDKDIKIDAESIFRLLAHANGCEKFYPDGTDYSVRVMRSPKRKGSGRALTGNSTSTSLNTKEKK
jgi:hypothetical protein|tara:strand:+ start:206 stop:619 length:414 start_codon:yes stop_codon:yes gene_type:complete